MSRRNNEIVFTYFYAISLDTTKLTTKLDVKILYSKTEGVFWKKITVQDYTRRSLTLFPYLESTGGLLLPTRWDASPSQGSPQHFVPIYTPGWRGTMWKETTRS